MRTEHEIMSAYNKDINDRLKKYCEENEPGTESEYKELFRSEADPYNMKSPRDAKNEYFKLANDFLTTKGY